MARIRPGRRIAPVAAILAVTLFAASAPSAQAAPDPSPEGSNDFTCKPSARHPRPVVLIHGLGASQANNWSYMAPRLKAAGYCVFSLTYGRDPRTAVWPYEFGGVIRMEDSSRELSAFVDRVLAATGTRELDFVGHSEGTVMPRYYLERRGGASKVRRFVALTPLWRGTELAATPFLRDSAKPFGLSDPGVALVAAFCGSCPQFVRGSGYLNDLNADGEAVPGIEHTNILTRYDELVIPYTSGIMRDGGTNIVLQDVDPDNESGHSAVAFDPVVFGLIRAALDQPLAPRATTGGTSLTALRLSRKRFRSARRGRAVAPKGRALGRRVGTRVRYRLSGDATVTFRVQRARRAKGRVVGRRCVRRSRRNVRARRCTRYRTVRGKFTHVGNEGVNRLRWSGRLRGRRLARGRYRLIARAVNSVGARSQQARARFRIVRR